MTLQKKTPIIVFWIGLLLQNAAMGSEEHEENDPYVSQVDEVMEDFAHLPRRVSLTHLMSILERSGYEVPIKKLASFEGRSSSLVKIALRLLEKGHSPSVADLGIVKASAALKTAFLGDIPVETDYNLSVIFPFSLPTKKSHKMSMEWAKLKSLFNMNYMKISQAKYTYPSTILHRHFDDEEREYGEYEGVNTYLYDHFDHAYYEKSEADIDRTACTTFDIYLSTQPNPLLGKINTGEPLARQESDRSVIPIATFVFTPTDRRFETMPIAPKQIQDQLRSVKIYQANLAQGVTKNL